MWRERKKDENKDTETNKRFHTPDVKCSPHYSCKVQINPKKSVMATYIHT
jgi:hypothetical protein